MLFRTGITHSPKIFSHPPPPTQSNVPPLAPTHLKYFCTHIHSPKVPKYFPTNPHPSKIMPHTPSPTHTHPKYFPIHSNLPKIMLQPPPNYPRNSSSHLYSPKIWFSNRHLLTSSNLSIYQVIRILRRSSNVTN